VLCDSGKWGNSLGPLTINVNGTGNGNALTLNGAELVNGNTTITPPSGTPLNLNPPAGGPA
jgi:hypothetical protein